MDNDNTRLSVGLWVAGEKLSAIERVLLAFAKMQENKHEQDRALGIMCCRCNMFFDEEFTISRNVYGSETEDGEDKLIRIDEYCITCYIWQMVINFP